MYKRIIKWAKALFSTEDKEERAQRELEHRILVYKRLLALRIANFERKHDTRLSRKQKVFIGRKLDERIKKMRKEHIRS